MAYSKLDSEILFWGTNLKVCIFRLCLDLGFMDNNVKEESKIYLIGFPIIFLSLSSSRRSMMFPIGSYENDLFLIALGKYY